ncbi:uncharacterized protein LOC110441347 [Mizuhopecten yessoensis]|nr:uncharacterized protein LOC110441347 [Mizuhopecten yessoensis]
MRLCKENGKQTGKTPGDGATANDTSANFGPFLYSTDRLTGKLQAISFSNAESSKMLKDICVVCLKADDVKTCKRCKQVKYCSMSCQRQDWSKHKHACKVASKLRARIPPNLDQRSGVLPNGAVGNGPIGKIDPNCLEVDLNYKATAKKELLDKAKASTKLLFPFHRILDGIYDIPDEYLGMRPGGTNSVLVAFISRYHDHVVRHCIYIGDKDGAEIYVAFYLDFDNPSPYFHWSDVVPGKYICIEDPYIHFFLNGAVGMRVDKAANVRILSV